MKLQVGQIDRKGRLVKNEVILTGLQSPSTIELVIKAFIIDTIEKYNAGQLNELPDFIKIADTGWRLPLIGRKKIKIAEALETGLQAFEDGIYLTFINNQKKDKLDEVVELKDDSNVMFVKLTFLSSGYGIANWI